MVVDVVPEAQIPCTMYYMYGMCPRNILIGHFLFFWTPIGKPFMYLWVNHGKYQLILRVMLLQAENFSWMLCRWTFFFATKLVPTKLGRHPTATPSESAIIHCCSCRKSCGDSCDFSKLEHWSMATYGGILKWRYPKSSQSLHHSSTETAETHDLGLLSAAYLEQSYLWLQWDSSQFFAETGVTWATGQNSEHFVGPSKNHPSYIIEVLVTSGIDNINNLHHW